MLDVFPVVPEADAEVGELTLLDMLHWPLLLSTGMFFKIAIRP